VCEDVPQGQSQQPSLYRTMSAMITPSLATRCAHRYVYSPTTSVRTESHPLYADLKGSASRVGSSGSSDPTGWAGKIDDLYYSPFARQQRIRDLYIPPGYWSYSYFVVTPARCRRSRGDGAVPKDGVPHVSETSWRQSGMVSDQVVLGLSLAASSSSVRRRYERSCNDVG
jgi:hypothetical protein